MYQHAVIGLEGLSLTDQEKTWLQKHTPKGVILFARNVQSPEQTKALLADVRKYAGKDIWAAIDEEGGRVHRMPWAPFNARTQAADFGALYKTDPDEAIKQVFNDSYAALARFYSMRVEPARPYKPKDKAKAEQGVQGIQRYILACFRHSKFFNVDDLNDAIADLLDRYNNKVMKHIEKSRYELYMELEKDELQSLPENRYVYEQYKRAKVNIDYHIILEKCYYSVPFKYLQKEVEVRYSSHHIRIYYLNEIIATHPGLRTIGQFSTLPEHRTPQHAYIHDKWNPQRFESWASSIGEYSTEFVKNALSTADYPEQAYRKILAILKLAKDYGYTEFELGLMYALENNTTTRKSIISILDKRLYLQSGSNNTNYKTPQLFNTHVNIRGADEYQ